MEQNKEIGKRIRQTRRMLNLTRKEMCESYYIEKQTLLLWELGHVSITDKAIHQCVQIFLKEGAKVTFDWLKYNKGDEPLIFKNTPTLCVNKHFYEKDSILPEFRFFLDVEAYQQNNKDAIIHQVKNKAMLPYLDIGDVVAGHPLPKDQYAKANGKMCIVSIENEKFLVRNFFRKHNKYILTAENASAKVITPLPLKDPPLIVAPVDFCRKMLLDDL